MNEDRMKVKVIGIVLGTASGWDEVSDFLLTFYDFETDLPGIPDGHLTVGLESGIFQVTDEDGEVLLEDTAFNIIKKIEGLDV